jgi:dihydrofolate reductase
MALELASIVSVDSNWAIGCQGRLLVPNKRDMEHFVAHTTGHLVIMGRKTLESLPGARPLKNRRNVVLTRDEAFCAPGFEVVHSLSELKRLLEDAELSCPEDAWVIGGASVYRELLPLCTRCLVTKNHVAAPGADVWFPNLDALPTWELETSQPGGVTPEGVAFDFCTYRAI